MTRKVRGPGILATLFPVWLIGILYAYNLSPKSFAIVMTIALIWPLPIAIFFGGLRFIIAPIYQEEPSVLICLSIFVGVVIATIPFSIDPGESLIYILLTIVGILICAGMWVLIRGCGEIVLARYAIVGTISLALINILVSSRGPRFDSIRNPNGIGLILMGIAVCALAVSNRIVKATLLITCTVLILATQSRNALIGTTLAMLVYLTLNVKSMHIGKVYFSALILLIICGVGALSYRAELSDQLANVLRLNAPGRGLNSGFSGRQILWREGYDAFLSSPWVGYGYRAAESSSSYNLDDYHDGYLQTLVETGLVGSTPIFLVFLLGGYRLTRQSLRGCHLSRIGLALLVGMMFFSIFEHYLINFGNPTSILALMFLLMPPSYSHASQKERLNRTGMPVEALIVVYRQLAQVNGNVANGANQ